MNQTPIITLSYKKDPRLKSIFSYPVYFLFLIYAILLFLERSSNNFFNAFVFYTFFFSIPILLIMIKYMPISDNLDRFKKFTIFEDKIILNDEIYPIEKVVCVIEIVEKGGRGGRGFIVSSWKSLELLFEGKNIGQFYFEIATCNDLFDISAERVKQLIEDIQKKNIINFDQRIQKDIEASKEDKDDETIVLLILLFFTLIPIGAGFLVYIMTR